MIAAEGYPDAPVKGDKIFFTERSVVPADAYILHAGTAMSSGGELTSAGGRVLNVVGAGPDVAAARAAAYGWPRRSGCAAAGTAGISPPAGERPSGSGARPDTVEA